jgi:hypothetical protein
MFPGRLSVALGSGEAGNEHTTGDGWPRKRGDRMVTVNQAPQTLQQMTEAHRDSAT